MPARSIIQRLGFAGFSVPDNRIPLALRFGSWRVGVGLMRKEYLQAAFLIMFSAAPASPAESGEPERFRPVMLYSTMRSDVTYTPVGLGRVTSPGERIHPVTGQASFHSGVDIAGKLNDYVFCMLDGVVVRAGFRGHMGYAVEIYHPYPDVRTVCGHLNAYAVHPGQKVIRGQVIGFAGSTGRSTGVHVHFTVLTKHNDLIEPEEFLQRVPAYVAQVAHGSPHCAAGNRSQHHHAG